MKAAILANTSERYLSEEEVIIQAYKSVNLLLISTTGRAGSMLLQSLFDGHPAVIVIPEVAQSYNYIDSFKEVDADISTWLDKYPKFYNGFDPKNKTFNSDISLSFSKNREKFETSFNNILSILGGKSSLNSKTFLIALSFSLSAIRGQNIDEVKYILFHYHNNRGIAVDLPLMLNDFPLLKVLVAIRHPIENTLSFQTLEKRTGVNSFRKFCRNTRGWSVKSWRNLQSLKQQLPNQDFFKLLDLNALHRNPDYILLKLVSWLDIVNHDSLKKPSISGIPWLGNSADGKPIEAFEKKRSILLYPTTIGTEQGLSQDEYLFAEYFCKDIMIKLGYDNSVKLQSINILQFFFILFKKIDFIDKNVIPHDKGIRKIIRMFGYSEIILVIKEVMAMKFIPIKPMKGNRLDKDEK